MNDFLIWTLVIGVLTGLLNGKITSGKTVKFLTFYITVTCVLFSFAVLLYKAYLLVTGAATCLVL